MGHPLDRSLPNERPLRRCPRKFARPQLTSALRLPACAKPCATRCSEGRNGLVTDLCCLGPEDRRALAAALATDSQLGAGSGLPPAAQPRATTRRIRLIAQETDLRCRVAGRGKIARPAQNCRSTLRDAALLHSRKRSFDGRRSNLVVGALVLRALKLFGRQPDHSVGH